MPELLRILHLGSHGADVVAAKHRLHDNRQNREFYRGDYSPAWDVAAQHAAIKAKWRLGYPEARITGQYGSELQGYLVPLDWKAGRRLPADYVARRLRRLGKDVPNRLLPKVGPETGYPLATRGEQIGYPYQGSHYHPSPSDDLHNWESCNAVDVGVEKGTPVLAVYDGVIGSQFGPLSSSNPVLLGIRLHLVTRGNEFYYAHLSSTARGIGPGDHVHQGQVLGDSGVANGVAHLHLASRSGDPGRLIGRPTPGYVDHHYPG